MFTPRDATILEHGVRELPPINLDGFEPSFGCAEYEWGAPVPLSSGDPWQDHQYHVEFLSWHYHDYLGTHAYVQVWDYAQQDDPDQRWQMMLLLHRPSRHVDVDDCIVGGTWAWTIRIEYEEPWSEGGPSHAQVGADIDLWLEAPEILRFIVE
jgi:hypothetical protein